MDNEVFCSIIVPIYNSEKYLKKCLDSLSMQDARLCEVILVNDGSTDNSQFICESYLKENINFILVNQKNKGHTAARNKGLSVAKGKYVAFVDSDDWLEENLISDCYEIYQHHQELDIILFGFKLIYTTHKKVQNQPFRAGFYDLKQVEKELLPFLITSGRFSLSERLVKREILQTYQKIVDPKIKLGEDMVCSVCSLANAKSVYVIDKPYYNYLQRENSIVHSYKNYDFDDWRLIKGILNEQISHKIKNFNEQMGYCSIRFLDRAVIGEIERNGLGLKSINAIKETLTEFESELVDASKMKMNRNRKLKLFCLKHKFIYLHYLMFKINQMIKK